MTTSSNANTTPTPSTLWPANAAELTDTTRCPACHTPLSSAVCSHCALDLTHPLAHDLAALSTQIADQFDKRTALIEQIRRETAAAAAAATRSAPVVTAPVEPIVPVPVAPVPVAPVPVAPVPIAPVSIAPVSIAPVPIAPAVIAPVAVAAATSAAAGPGKPRRSGVQVTLLAAGIILVSVFAIFFMVYAFINYGLVWRSVIIGLVTIATLVAASLLRRRKLTASAEGIAALGVVLLVLDAFAIRANDMLGAGLIDGAIYWGVALLVLAGALWLWHTLARLRTARVAASLLIVPGAFTLALGIGNQIYDIAFGYGIADSVYTAALVASVAGLARVAFGRRTAGPHTDAAVAERIITLAFTVPAVLLAGLVSTVVAAQLIGSNTIAMLAVAVVTAAHYFASSLRARDALERGTARAFAYASGALAVTAAALLPSRFEWANTEDLTLAAPAVTALVAGVLWLLITRPALSRKRIGALSSTIGAVSITAITLAYPTAIALAFALRRALDSLLLLRTVPLDHATEITTLHGTSVLVLLAASGTLWLLRAVRVLPAKTTPTLAIITTTVALSSVALAPTLWALLLGWLAIGIVGLLGTHMLSARPLRAALTPAAHVAAAGGLTLAWVAGWASAASWPVTSLVAIAATLYVRRRSASAPLRLASSTIAAGLALIGAAAASQQLIDTPGSAALGAGIMAALLVCGAGLVPRRPEQTATAPHERQVIFWIGLSVAALVALSTALVAGGAQAFADAGDETAPLRLTLAAAALAGTLIWQLKRTNSINRIEVTAAAAATTPALAWLAVSALATAGVTDAVARATTIGVASAVVAAASLGLHLSKNSTRLPLDLGATATSAAALLLALATVHHPWLLLLVAATTALMLAVSRDGIIGSASPRKHIGWAAIALATAALWSGLAQHAIAEPEPYVLPLAAALLTIAALSARSAKRRNTAAAGAWWLGLSALLIAVIPLAVASGAGHETRATLTLAGSAVLLLGATLARTKPLARAGTSGLAELYLPAALAGALGVALVTTIRSALAISGAGENLEGWLVAGVAVLVTAGTIATILRHTPPALGPTLLIGGLAILAIAQSAAAHLTTPSHAESRATATIIVLALAHIAGATILRNTAIAWASVGIATITAVATLNTVDTIELVTAPLAAALLTTGAIALARTPQLRSWPWLGPGTVLLLLPSLLITLSDRPLWRLVGLGIVALAITIIAVVLRLQAPFIVAIGVLVIHGIGTLQPQIRAVYELADWYVWAGIGGVLLIALAIRYEHRIRDLKKAVSGIRSLR